uniref:Uncharacterized protein n=1 Tax=Aureoumbra lagunensis TaxID=44058 RepID=A0A7S3NJ84_9STRA|mmetsp:Transcript_12296/g.14942  ORF Transcript_12296/g.14942 Transcript_12296/m.14942 type:complete len:312 (+) Transcript_12296:1651-2586(+)
MSYLYRPVPLSATEVSELKVQIQSRTDELIRLTTQLRRERHISGTKNKRNWFQKRKSEANDLLRLNKLKQMVYVLEIEKEEYDLLTNQQYNPMVYKMNLVLGVLASFYSIFWLLQILLYLLIDPSASPFLNIYIIQFQHWFPIFGSMTAVSFAAFLQLAVMKGCFKFGIRFFLIDLHPLKFNKTSTHSFMCNLAIYLCTTFSVVHLLVNAFAEYARYTDIAGIFIQVRYLDFFTIFFDNRIFEILFLLFAALTSIWFAFSGPRDRPASAAKLRASLLADSSSIEMRQNLSSSSSKYIIIHRLLLLMRNKQC